jgi:hypothetical protein
MNENELLHLTDVPVEKIHALIHVAEVEVSGGKDIGLGKASIPDPQPGFGLTHTICRHGQEGSLLKKDG